MSLLAGAFLSIAIVLILASYWKFNFLIVAFTSTSLILFEISRFKTYPHHDILSYAFYICCILLLVYFVESHRITNSDISSRLQRNNFKEYLIKNKKFTGYNWLIYQLPIFSLISILVFVFLYFLLSGQSFSHQIADFFKNWSNYPNTLDD